MKFSTLLLTFSTMKGEHVRLYIFEVCNAFCMDSADIGYYYTRYYGA